MLSMRRCALAVLKYFEYICIYIYIYIFMGGMWKQQHTKKIYSNNIRVYDTMIVLILLLHFLLLVPVSVWVMCWLPCRVECWYRHFTVKFSTVYYNGLASWCVKTIKINEIHTWRMRGWWPMWGWWLVYVSFWIHACTNICHLGNIGDLMLYFLKLKILIQFGRDN